MSLVGAGTLSLIPVGNASLVGIDGITQMLLSGVLSKNPSGVPSIVPFLLVSQNLVSKLACVLTALKPACQLLNLVSVSPVAPDKSAKSAVEGK